MNVILLRYSKYFNITLLWRKISYFYNQIATLRLTKYIPIVNITSSVNLIKKQKSSKILNTSLYSGPDNLMKLELQDSRNFIPDHPVSQKFYW